LIAPVCRTGVLFVEPTEVQILPRALKFSFQERDVTGNIPVSKTGILSSSLSAPVKIICGGLTLIGQGRSLENCCV
jgi:hypothetical protein